MHAAKAEATPGSGTVRASVPLSLRNAVREIVWERESSQKGRGEYRGERRQKSQETPAISKTLKKKGPEEKRKQERSLLCAIEAR